MSAGERDALARIGAHIGTPGESAVTATEIDEYLNLSDIRAMEARP